MAEPEEKRDVVAAIVPMPEGANQEGVHLTEHLIPEGSTLVDTSSQPLLRSHIPVGDFDPHMHGAFHNFRVASLNEVVALLPIFVLVVADA